MHRFSHHRINPFTLLVFFFLITLAAPQAFAATITVNSTADTVTADANCTLREAINNVNAGGQTTGGECVAATGGDIIDLATIGAATFTITGAAGDDANATGDFDIEVAVTISGAGSGLTIIDGGAIDRVFHVTVAVAVTFDGVTIQNGTTTVGGGIYANGAVTLTNSTVSGNTAARDGGGLLAYGDVTLTDSTVSGNEATTGEFGGIYTVSAVTLTNSTVSNNIAGGSYGGIYASLGFSATNSTIYDNSNAGTAGGVYVRSGTAVLSNTIVANNTGGPDCANNAATWTSSGYNIDSDGTCLALSSGTGDFTADPLVSALANNGGTTWTHALLVGSPALDAGSCVNGTDQRGYTRPSGATCDIGAYEAEQFLLSVTVSGTGSVTGGTAIDCPATPCAEYHWPGTSVTLIAIASSGETFTGWGGACAASGTATTCTLTMSAAKTVSASFGGFGCMNATATNYSPLATVDDGSCTYASSGSSSSGNQAPTAGRHGDAWLHYPDEGDVVGSDTQFVWDELIDPDGDTVYYDLYVCLDGDFTNCNPISVTPTYRTIAAVGFGMTGVLVVGFCLVGGIRSFRGRMIFVAAVLVAGLALSHCGSSDSGGSSTDSGNFSCDGEDGFSVCYDSKGLSAGDYQWRVTASDASGASTTSETRSFTVE